MSELYRRKQQEIQDARDDAQDIKPLVETYTAFDNGQVKNTIGTVASITGAGNSSPTITILKRCKVWVNGNGQFSGSTNGVIFYVVVDGQNVSGIAFGANPNGGISGSGGGYISILEVGEVLTMNWGGTNAASRDLSILLEEIQ